jgi:hypothetical protein
MVYQLPRDVEEELALRQVDTLARLPGAWWYQAMLLLLAAENMAPAIRGAEQRQRDMSNGTGTRSGEMTGAETADMFHVGTKSVWIMLVGLAVENLLKALTAAKLKIKPHAGRHELEKLAGSVLTLQGDEKALLLEMSHYVRWRGRYLAPRGVEEYLRHRSETAGAGFRYWRLDEADARVRALVGRIEAELQALGQRRPG